MRTLLLLAVAATLLNAQAPATGGGRGASGRGGFGRGPNYNGPASLTWLWRDYDPANTTQMFVQEESERAEPLWRIVTMDRE